MDWEKIRHKLEQILQTPITVKKLSAEEWKEESAFRTVENSTYFLLERSGQHNYVLLVEQKTLSESELRLIELTIDMFRNADKPKQTSPITEEERKALLIKDWFHHQMELGNTQAEVPDLLASQLSFYKTKIPLLLYGDYSDSRNVQYRDLKRLLDSFFESEIHLIPLMEKEWLILGSESLLSESDSEERDEEDEERIEDSLTSICLGLYEMLSNEWVGECHLSIHYPMTPAKSLLSTVLQLRETMMLGRTFNLGSNIHLPWKLQMEKLFNEIPDGEKAHFIEQVFKRNDHALDVETLQTLEHFFALDCNVSETAKKLYIHRNTLLYRLDKFKQETGLDVRTFNDAVLVRIALLLYKVTKRK